MYGKGSHEIFFLPLTCHSLGVWDGGIARVGDFHVGLADCQVGRSVMPAAPELAEHGVRCSVERTRLLSLSLYLSLSLSLSLFQCTLSVLHLLPASLVGEIVCCVGTFTVH